MKRAAVLLALVPTPALAQSQSEMNEQAAADFRRADEALNAAYRATVAQLRDDREQRAVLLKAQRAWVQFRDAECQLRSWNERGGTVHPAYEYACLTKLTRARTRQLRDEP